MSWRVCWFHLVFKSYERGVVWGDVGIGYGNHPKDSKKKKKRLFCLYIAFTEGSIIARDKKGKKLAIHGKENKGVGGG